MIENIISSNTKKKKKTDMKKYANNIHIQVHIEFVLSYICSDANN